MADDEEEEEAATRRVRSGDARCRHMLLNNVKAQDILPPSCKVVTMKKSTAVSQGLVDAPDEAAQPGADVLDEELAFVQHYKHAPDAKVCEWYTYEHTSGLREGELQPLVQPALGAGKIRLVHTALFKLDMIVKHAYLNGGLDGKIKGARRPNDVLQHERDLAMRRLDVCTVAHQAAQGFMVNVDPAAEFGFSPESMQECCDFLAAVIAGPGGTMCGPFAFGRDAVRSRPACSSPAPGS